MVPCFLPHDPDKGIVTGCAGLSMGPASHTHSFLEDRQCVISLEDKGDTESYFLSPHPKTGFTVTLAHSVTDPGSAA